MKKVLIRQAETRQYGEFSNSSSHEQKPKSERESYGDQAKAGEAWNDKESRRRFLKRTGGASLGVVTMSLVAPQMARASGSGTPTTILQILINMLIAAHKANKDSSEISELETAIKEYISGTDDGTYLAYVVTSVLGLGGSFILGSFAGMAMAEALGNLQDEIDFSWDDVQQGFEEQQDD